MPIVKSDIPQHLLAGMRTEFFSAYEQAIANANWARVATLVPSTMDTETYGWLGSIPSVRELVDERVIEGLSEYDYTIKNKTWVATIGVDRAALEDDQYGHIRLRIQGLAGEVSRHKDQIVFEQLAAGFATNCYDGQYMFDTDHLGGDSGTQSNKGTAALTAESLDTAIIAMSKFKDDKGKPMGILPDTLVVPPDLRSTARAILESTVNGGGILGVGTKNVMEGVLELVVSPYLTDTSDWFVLDTKRTVKPVIFQDRIPLGLEALEGNSENGFMRDMWLYGVRARYNVGYGLWQLAYGSSVT